MAAHLMAADRMAADFNAWRSRLRLASALGLCIPLLLAMHVSSTRIAETFLDTQSYYTSILILQWILAPYLAVVQAAALLTVWIHACIGLHFWLRTKS